MAQKYTGITNLTGSGYFYQVCVNGWQAGHWLYAVPLAVAGEKIDYSEYFDFNTDAGKLAEESIFSLSILDGSSTIVVGDTITDTYAFFDCKIRKTYSKIEDFAAAYTEQENSLKKCTNKDILPKAFPYILNYIRGKNVLALSDRFKDLKVTVKPYYNKSASGDRSYSMYYVYRVSITYYKDIPSSDNIWSDIKRHNFPVQVTFASLDINSSGSSAVKILVDIGTSTEDIVDLNTHTYTELSDIYSSVSGSLYKVPDNGWDLWKRILFLRCHATYWNNAGQPTAISPDTAMYMDPNCYAFTQGVYKAGTSNWYMNESSDIATTRGVLVVNSAYFADGKKYTEAGPGRTWYPYTVLTNGQGHNIDNGDTLGVEMAAFYNSAYLPFTEIIDSASQSAICFTNVTNLTDGNALQEYIDVHTSGTDFASTIVEGTIPTITLEVSGQNIGRFNLETNNLFTRW